jgi:sarcosine oxidase
VIAVVGAGIAGAATARALARRGAEVVLLEQFELGHRHGSSHGTSRIFRLSYPETEWVALAQEALTLWRELERESATELLVFTGLVDAVDDVERWLAALAEQRVPCELLSGREGAERFGLAYEDERRLLFQPDAGIARADSAHRAFLDGLRRAGGEVREHVRVTALEPGRGGVRVACGSESLRADSVVVTAGAWVRPLLEPLGIDVPVTVTRETVAYFRVEGGWTPPSVIDDVSAGAPGDSFYALLAPGVGLKAGAHLAGAVVDPDDDDGVPDPALVDAVAAWVRARFPRAARDPLAAETCLYTSTFDHRFLLRREGRVVLGSACSGHGFKFAPAIGERLAALALAAGD